jgi:hypothetical protein
VQLQLRAVKCMYPHIVLVRYTTVSQPECVDGWLGLQLRDKLWFSCWGSKEMTESAAKIIPLITSQESTTAALQPANVAASSSPASVQSNRALQDTQRNATTPAADDAARSGKLITSLQLQLDALQAANKTLAARSQRDGKAPDVVPAADASRLYGVIEKLLSSQQAIQERLEATNQRLQESILDLAASQRQAAQALDHAVTTRLCRSIL